MPEFGTKQNWQEDSKKQSGESNVFRMRHTTPVIWRQEVKDNHRSNCLLALLSLSRGFIVCPVKIGWRGQGEIKPEQIAGILTPAISFDLSQQFLWNCKSSPGHTTRLRGDYLSQSFPENTDMALAGACHLFICNSSAPSKIARHASYIFCHSLLLVLFCRVVPCS